MSNQKYKDYAMISRGYKEKSVYNYFAEKQRFLNNNYGHFELPFLNYIPAGVGAYKHTSLHDSRVEIENDLRNMYRINTRCPDIAKYKPN